MVGIRRDHVCSLIYGFFPLEMRSAVARSRGFSFQFNMICGDGRRKSRNGLLESKFSITKIKSHPSTKFPHEGHVIDIKWYSISTVSSLFLTPIFVGRLENVLQALANSTWIHSFSYYKYENTIFYLCCVSSKSQKFQSLHRHPWMFSILQYSSYTCSYPSPWNSMPWTLPRLFGNHTSLRNNPRANPCICYLSTLFLGCPGILFWELLYHVSNPTAFGDPRMTVKMHHLMEIYHLVEMNPMSRYPCWYSCLGNRRWDFNRLSASSRLQWGHKGEDT